MLLNIYHEIDQDYFIYQIFLGINLYFYKLFQIKLTFSLLFSRWKFLQNITLH